MSSALFIVGLVLLGIFVNATAFSAFPLQPLSSAWQLRMSGALLSNGTFALLGVLLVCLSLQSPSSLSDPNAKRASLIRKLAGWAAIAYLILIPGQIAAGIKFVNQKASEERQPIELWGKLRSRIQITESEDELREILQKFPNMPQLPDKFPVPFNQLKSSIVSDLDARFAALDTQITKTASERWQGFLGEVLRNSIQSILLAAGFSAVSQQASKRTSGRKNYLQKLIP